MGDVILFQKESEVPEMKLLKRLPKDMAVFLVTGYTDLRKSIAGLSSDIETYFSLDPQSRCMTFFCGRRIDRFKMLMYDGDGFIVMSKRFDSKKLKWPRLGGNNARELWVLTHKQFEDMMTGTYELTTKEIDEAGESIDEPEINTLSNSLYRHIISDDCAPRRIFLCTGYTDLRYSINTYCSIASRFHLDPEDDFFFLFCGKGTDKMKILYHDGDGYLVITKHFDSTRLQWPREKNEMWNIVYSQMWDLLNGKEIPREEAIRVYTAY